MKKLLVLLTITILSSLSAGSRGEAKVIIGDDTLTVELAITPLERQVGLMFREYLPENRGMLFVFESEDYLTFWMKNTSIPLSIAFINPEGIIVDIQNMEPFTTTPHVSKERAIYALEVNKGWFKKHGITVGDTVKIITE